jgi:hypothetical protein
MMLVQLIVILFSAFFLSGCNLFAGRSGVEIVSFPSAKVFVNGVEAGMTPYKNNDLTPGEAEIKLVANSQEWTKKIKLQKNANTVIDWEFGEEEKKSGGYVLYMEETGDSKKTGLIVSSNPDRAAVSIEGEIKGLSPIKLEDIGEGDKQVTISFPGHKSANVFIRGIKGYRLIIEASLGREKVVEPIEEEVEVELSQNLVAKVKILETGTGWLRVREEASSASREIDRVIPGEEYELLNEQTDWVLIKIEEGTQGWVSATFVEKI